MKIQILTLLILFSSLSLVLLDDTATKVINYKSASKYSEDSLSFYSNFITSLKFNVIPFKGVTVVTADGSQALEITNVQLVILKPISLPVGKVTLNSELCTDSYTITTPFKLNFTSTAKFQEMGKQDIISNFLFSVKLNSLNLIKNKAVDTEGYYYTFQSEYSFGIYQFLKKDLTSFFLQTVEKTNTIVEAVGKNSMDIMFKIQFDQLGDIGVDSSGPIYDLNISPLPNSKYTLTKLQLEVSQPVTCDATKILYYYSAKDFLSTSVLEYNFGDIPSSSKQALAFSNSLLDELIVTNINNPEYNFVLTKSNTEGYSPIAFTVNNLKNIFPYLIYYYPLNIDFSINGIMTTNPIFAGQDYFTIHFDAHVKINNDDPIKFTVDYAVYPEFKLKDEKFSLTITDANTKYLNSTVDYMFGFNNLMFLEVVKTTFSNYIQRNPFRLFEIPAEGMTGYKVLKNKGVVIYGGEQ